MPRSSKTLTNASRRSAYSFTWVAKRLCSFARSRPTAAASWRGELGQNMILVETAKVGLMIDSGPTSQPTRQPVAENSSAWTEMWFSRTSRLKLKGRGNLLPAEPTVTVLSHIPGRVAIRTCSWPSYNKQSYCSESSVRSYGISGLTRDDSYHFV